LPNITLNDLAITGAGTFRLKGSDLGHRELSDDNFEDTYRNICAIFGEVISMCGDMRKLPEDYSDLEKKLASLTLSDLRDRYQISYDPFFLPLANKCTALLRMIDVILQMPERSTEFIDFTQNLPYMDVIGGCPVWQDMALKNDYTTGNAASTESALLCREPDPKLSAQRRFAESKGFSSRHRKNPRYRVPVPRGNSAASRHRRPLTAQRICAESCRSGPSAQPPPHGAT
jgi:hypothetical protein